MALSNYELAFKAAAKVQEVGQYLDEIAENKVEDDPSVPLIESFYNFGQLVDSLNRLVRIELYGDQENQ